MKYVVKKDEYDFGEECPFYRQYGSYPSTCCIRPNDELGRSASCHDLGGSDCPLAKEDVIVHWEGRKKP